MKNAALILYGLVGLGFMGLGITYLLADEFMPYHADAIGVGWSDLDANYQGLFLGLAMAYELKEDLHTLYETARSVKAPK